MQPQNCCIINQDTIAADKPPIREIVGSNFMENPTPMTNPTSIEMTIFHPSLNFLLGMISQ